MVDSARRIRVLITGEGIVARVAYQVGYELYDSNYYMKFSNMSRALESDPKITVERIWGPAIIDDFPKKKSQLE